MTNKYKLKELVCQTTALIFTHLSFGKTTEQAEKHFSYPNTDANELSLSLCFVWDKRGQTINTEHNIQNPTLFIQTVKPFSLASDGQLFLLSSEICSLLLTCDLTPRPSWATCPFCSKHPSVPTCHLLFSSDIYLHSCLDVMNTSFMMIHSYSGWGSNNIRRRNYNQPLNQDYTTNTLKAPSAAEVDAPTWPLTQSGDVWGHVGDGHHVASRCGRGGGVAIFYLNGEESLHVGVFLSLRDCFSSCSPWGSVFFCLTGGRHDLFSRKPRPTHGALWLAGWRQRLVRCSFLVRYILTVGSSWSAGQWARTWPSWRVSRCVQGSWRVCKQFCGSGDICLATVDGGGPVPQRGFLQSGDVWALAGFCELAHSITNRVSAAELLQDDSFLFRGWKEIIWNQRKTTKYWRRHWFMLLLEQLILFLTSSDTPKASINLMLISVLYSFFLPSLLRRLPLLCLFFIGIHVQSHRQKIKDFY